MNFQVEGCYCVFYFRFRVGRVPHFKRSISISKPNFVQTNHSTAEIYIINYWFGKTNIRHIAMLLPVSILTTNFSWPFSPSSGRLEGDHNTVR